MRKQTPDILSGLMGQSDAVSTCWYTSQNVSMLEQKPAKATYFCRRILLIL